MGSGTFKKTVLCLNCQRPILLIINGKVPNDINPIAFCNPRCFNEFKCRPKRGGEGNAHEPQTK